MSATLINRIVELSGPMPDEKAHRRYLAGLMPHVLEARIQALQEPSKKEKNAAGEFWGARKNHAEQQPIFT